MYGRRGSDHVVFRGRADLAGLFRHRGEREGGKGAHDVIAQGTGAMAPSIASTTSFTVIASGGRARE